MDYWKKAGDAATDIKANWARYALFLLVGVPAVWTATSYVQKEMYEWRLNRAESEKEDLRKAVKQLQDKQSTPPTKPTVVESTPVAGQKTCATCTPSYDPCEHVECTTIPSAPIPTYSPEYTWTTDFTSRKPAASNERGSSAK